MFLIFLLASVCLTSCQTLTGMGNDLNRLGKSLAAPKPKVAAVSAPVQKKSADPVSKASNTSAVSAIKPTGAAPGSPLQRLHPLISNEGMFSTRETPESISLEDLPEKTDIQEVPQRREPWSGASVDVNGDGIPDVRYRQREQ